MSRLDNLYTQFRIFCKQNPTEHSATKFYDLHLYEDGTGEVVLVDFCGTNDNPFKVIRSAILSFKTPGEGARKLEKLNEQKTIS